MTLFSLLISCVNHELVFVVDSISQPRLNFQRWFLDEHWQSVFDNSILNHQYIFAIDMMRRSCCRFHTSAVTKISVVISRSAATMFSLTIFVRSDAVSVAIPCINDDSVFFIDFMRESWINVRCRFHQSAATQLSKLISRSTGTSFSVTIYGLALPECVWQFHT